MSSDSIPDGINCGKCNTHMPFNPWVYAHWDEELFSACPKCSTRHSIRQGKGKMVDVKQTPEQRRQDLREASSDHGYELVWSDLRTGVFHLRKGSEVRQGYISRNAVDAGQAVNLAIKNGMRLDQVESSRYFAGGAND